MSIYHNNNNNNNNNKPDCVLYDQSAYELTKGHYTCTCSWLCIKNIIVHVYNLNKVHTVCNLQLSIDVHLKSSCLRVSFFKIHRHVERALDDIVAAKQSEAEKVCPGLNF